MPKNGRLGEGKNRHKIKSNEKQAEKECREAGVYQKNDKFYCSQCHSELPMQSDCPTCQAHIDWDRIKAEMKL